MSKNHYCYAIFLLLSFVSRNSAAATFSMPSLGNDIVGSKPFVINVQAGDSSTTIRQRYEVSFKELSDANPRVDFDKLQVRQEISIPSQFILPEYRTGVVINLAELRLYYFTPNGKYVLTYPVGLGRENWRTPTTITSVASKEEDPAWRVPESIRAYTYEKEGELLPQVVPPGPDNPLGAFALHLKHPGYLIHGTNDQASVGLYVSSGCIRMQKDAISKLFEIVPIGTPVYIVNHTNKVGWLEGKLYMQSYSSIRLSEKLSALNYQDTATAITNLTANHPAKVDWQLVQQIERQHRAIPTLIGEYNNNAQNNNQNDSTQNKKPE